jgi:hypothetical protein
MLMVEAKSLIQQAGSMPAPGKGDPFTPPSMFGGRGLSRTPADYLLF